MFLRHLLTFLILRFFHPFVGIKLSIYILYSIIRFHGYNALFYNVGILKIIDTRNFFFLLSFYLFVSSLFISFISFEALLSIISFIFLSSSFNFLFYLSLIFLLLPLLFYYCYVSWLRIFSV